MGVEVWAFAALITVLAAYLLPFLVGRREIAGQSHVQDRYSAELRVLDTGTTTVDPGDTCERSGHAELFRRRPEVKAMNRPAVRNVRALRTERELTRARKAHAQARERRRVAASHRGVVACVLLGVALGAWVIGVLTALPWWPALVPSVLLGVSMVAGRRAAKASASADRRERRRIAELERELTGLTGRRPSVPVVSTRRSQEAQAGAEPEEPRRPDFDEAVLSGEGSTSVHVAPRFVQESFRARAGAVAREEASARAEASSAGRQESAARAARASAGPKGVREAGSYAEKYAQKHTEKDVDKEARRAGERAQETRKAEAGRAGRSGDEAWRKGPEGTADPEGSKGASAPRAQEDLKQLEGRESREDIKDKDSEDAVRAGRSSGPSGDADEAGRGSGATAGSASAAQTPATPPQGWKPVHVPAPTYTLAPRAPRRAYSEPVVDEGESAPVPARPHTVRTFSTPDFEEEEFQPIDLDAILERRRAAGE